MNFAFFNPRVCLRNWLLQPSQAEIEGYLRQEQAKFLRAQRELERLQPPLSMKGSGSILERIEPIISNWLPRPMIVTVSTAFQYVLSQQCENAKREGTDLESRSVQALNPEQSVAPTHFHGHEQSAHSPRRDQDGSQ